MSVIFFFFFLFFFFFQAEDGIRDLVRSRGPGDVYKRQRLKSRLTGVPPGVHLRGRNVGRLHRAIEIAPHGRCLLYTSDAADERSSVDLGGRRIIKKNNTYANIESTATSQSKHKLPYARGDRRTEVAT